jgi:hypothetical protein
VLIVAIPEKERQAQRWQLVSLTSTEVECGARSCALAR